MCGGFQLKTLAPSSDKPVALWIFGPSAVGKSSLMGAKVSELLGCVQNGVLIDGAEFREVHAGWQAVTAHGHEHGLLHADAWPMFKEAGRRLSRASEEKESNGFTGQMKRQLLREALRDRQHVVIPDCANHLDRLQHMIEEVRSCGYHGTRCMRCACGRRSARRVCVARSARYARASCGRRRSTPSRHAARSPSRCAGLMACATTRARTAASSCGTIPISPRPRVYAAADRAAG